MLQFKLFSYSKFLVVMKHLILVTCLGAVVSTSLLTLPGDSERTFRSLIEAATCLPRTVEASHCSFLIAERHAEKL